ncbi:MAG: response regulator [Lachnospiraceae bacterium]|nr:response regulator [Lachnospiraceae bacterium]MBP5185298.1 response regulator [Lachnospiraceae bacterium]
MQYRIMMTGAKQTFLTRVLEKKLQDAGFDCEFVNWDVDDINSNWKDTVLVVMYLEEGLKPGEEVLHYLTDKMADTDDMMIVIGEKDDCAYVCDHFRNDLIYRTFYRPVNNDEFIRAVTNLLKKIESGEFKKSILVVDDDPNYLSLVREWLKDTYKVSMANSGLQAIKWLGKNKVDLILLDHEMPVTPGPKVLEMLRSDSETASIPVMFLTGKSDKESVMQVVALKPEGYFLKTIGKDELLHNLGEFFAKHKM